MAGRHVTSRKATAFVQTPKVTDPSTQRALDVHHQAILDLQSRRFLELFTADEDGYVPASGGAPGQFLAGDGIWKTVTGSGLVDSVAAGSSMVTVAPTTGNVIVNVVPANFTGIPQSAVTNLISDLAGKVPTSRLISTTSPLQGGGDLSADRILSVLAFGAAQSGVVPASGGGSVNYLRADGIWANPVSGYSSGTGTLNTVVKFTGSGSTIGNSLLADDATTLNYNSGKFTVAAVSGNTLAAGTLDVTGNFNVNTNKFSVVAASGNTTVAGTLSVTGDFNVNTSKFTVAASSGNTVVAGTITVNGNTQLGDATTDRVGIGGAPDPNNILTFAQAVGAKLALYPVSATAAYGFGIQSSHLQHYVPSTAERFSFGIGISGAYTEKLTILGTGSMYSLGDDTYLGWDAQSGARVGFTKKSGAVGKLTYGSANSFAIAQSSGTSIAATNTFTDRLVINSSGNTSVTGTLDSTGDFNVNTNKFSVIAASGNTTVAGTLNVNGNTTIGDTGGDAHTLNGTLTANGTAASDGWVLAQVSGLPKWTALSGVSGVTGTGGVGYISVWTSTTNQKAATGLTESVSDGGLTIDGTAITAAITLNNALTSSASTTGRTAYRTTHTGTTNTTAGALTNFGFNASVTTTRSAGAFSLSNVAIRATASGAQVNQAIITESGDVVLNNTDGITAIKGAVTIGGNTLASTLTVSNTSGSALTADRKHVYSQAAGSFDVTGASLSNYAFYADASATRAAGANTVTNYGVYVTATTSAGVAAVGIYSTVTTGETAFKTGDGLVVLNDVGGTTTIKGATTLTSTLSVNGNATFGDASSDTHTLNGNLTFSNAPTAGSVKIGSVNGRIYIGRQVITGASGTYTPTTGTKAVLVRMVGGGGGGGGAGGGANLAVGGGGASGTYFEKWIDPAATVTGGAYANGAAGSAGASTGGNGGNGGDTTIVVQGTTYTAKGGLGGVGVASTAGNLIKDGGAGQAGSSSGDVVYQEAGGQGWVLASTFVSPGNGGSTALGAGGAGGVASADHAGNAASGNGAGGAGAAANSTNRAGAAGTIGIIIIDEYF